jgi:hypothetical protein
MFTRSQSRKIWKRSLVLIVAAALLATTYSIIFGNPGAAWWASLFVFPIWGLTVLWSGVISSGIRRVTNSYLAGIGVGVFIAACLATANWLLFLRLIQELEDNMMVEEISSLSVYAWMIFCFYAANSFISYFLMWGLWLAIKWVKIRFSQSEAIS